MVKYLPTFDMPMNKIKPNVKLIEVEGNEEDTQEDIQPILDSGKSTKCT